MTSMEDIERTAREADEKVQRIQEYGASLADKRHTFPLANQLGTLTVSGRADLLSIDLDTRRLSTTRPDALADAVVRALRNAEDTVRQQVSEDTARLAEGDT